MKGESESRCASLRKAATGSISRRSLLKGAAALGGASLITRSVCGQGAVLIANQKKLAALGGPRAVPDGLRKGWPLITDEEKAAVMKVLERGVLWGTDAPETAALEKEWAEFIGTKHCIATNGGTAALHMGVAAAGIEPGDEVITCAYSWFASASCIVHHNGVPRFVDIQPRTFNIDPAKIEEKITPKTRAIIPVHLFGLPADMDEINAIAKKHSLIVIEDACQAHGAMYKGKRAGNLADMGAFSLNGTKNLPGGEGGLFNTNNDLYADRAEALRMFGEIEHIAHFRGRGFSEFGWNYRPQEFTSAFTKVRIKRLDAENAVRRANAAYLTKHLSEIKGVLPPYVPADRTHVYHMYRIRLDPTQLGLSVDAGTFRRKVQRALNAEGVPVGGYKSMPIPGHNLFKLKVGYGKGCPWSCPHSGEGIVYRAEDYPETLKMLDDSFLMTSALYPPNGLELMKHYANAFEKVFADMDQLMKVNG
jgi:perosamine synthetase